MKLRLAAGLAVSSTLGWAFQPRVYLLPTRGMLTEKYDDSTRPPMTLTLPQANKVIANHLGLDMYESLEDNGEGKEWQRLLKGGVDALFRNGDRPPRSTVMFVVHTDHPDDILNQKLDSHPDFYINATLSSGDVSALMATYVAHAHGSFDTVSSGLNWYRDAGLEFDVSWYEDSTKPFHVPGKSAALFLEEYHAYSRYLEGPWDKHTKLPLAHRNNYEPSDFAAFEITSLDLLAEEYGPDSEQYQKAIETVRSWLDPSFWDGEASLALVIKPKTESQERSPRQGRSVAPIERRASPPGSVPIYSCFQSADSCGNATSSCSGRGSCVPVSRAGKTCYTCKCQASKSEDGMSTTYWAGERCERKDVSSQFVLLTGTVIGVLVVAFGSVTLLYAVGDEKLPGTLTGGAVHGSKHD